MIVQEMSSSSVEVLTAVAQRSSRLAQSALVQQAAEGDALAQAAAAVHGAQAQVRRRLTEQAQAEGRYLMQEYRVYAPSGQ